jgi:glycosyltransferase involved in cell wall biosynthesis
MAHKIIQINHGTPNPNSLNGVNKVVHYLSSSLEKLNCEVEVWCLTDGYESAKFARSYKMYSYKKNKNRFQLDPKLKHRVLSLKNMDVVFHFHSVFIPEFYSLARILKKLNIPWIITPHSGYAKNSLKKNYFVKKVYFLLFENYLIQNSQLIHIIGHSEKDDIRTINDRIKTILIPNGQSRENLYSEGDKIKIEKRGMVFGYCGRLAIRQKGLDLLFAGFHQYCLQNGSANLWLIGDGPDKKTLHTIATKLGLQNRILFLGKMFDSEKIAHINQMDFFVHSSRWEGLPTAVLEATALNKPIIISNQTNMGEYVKEYTNGLVIEYLDSNCISSTLHKAEAIFNTPAYEKMKRASGQLTTDNFDWDNIAEQALQNLYQTKVNFDET